MHLRRIIFLICWLFAAALTHAQERKNSDWKLTIKKTSGMLVIDGIRSETDWERAAVASNFAMVLPMDTSAATLRTDVRMAFDENNLYIIAECYHGGWPYMVESLRRDWNFGRNDNFIFFLDTFDDKTNGFSFGANAAGAQWDGMMSDGSRIDLSWDNKWVSASKAYDDHWTFEAAIPFKSIRYKKGIRQWGVNFSRNDLTTTEKSAWAPVPRQFPTASLAFTGILQWEESPPDPGTNISLIPYLLVGTSRDFQNNGKSKWRDDIGGDAKIALNSSLNLDLTVNPDFSQVDVDRQVTNLDRFELFFPERRQFFLENGDLFANVGYGSLRPFFSRRIGLGVPIQYGARLSGKINRNWRVGAMDMVTREVEEKGLPRQNFATLAVQRRVFTLSYVTAMLVSKNSIDYTPPVGSDLPTYAAYNQNAGLEYNIQSADNRWTGKMLYFKSFSPGVSGKDAVQAGNLQYSDRNWQVGGQYEFVGINYNPEVGYVPRRGYLKVNPMAQRLFFPKGTRILTHGPSFGSTRFYDPAALESGSSKPMNMDNETYLAYNFTMRTRSVFTGWVARNFVRLYQPFDPTNSGKEPIETGTEHYWRAFGMEYASKPQRLFTWSASTRYGGYYAGGTRFNLAGEFAYRIQPYAVLAIAANYNRIALPEPWSNVRFLLISPRVDVTMTNKLYITGFAQYNEQTKNVNLNTRIQWRYKPASDFFLVYTDNYLPENFSVKNRALVVKWTYWWNI
ncbi:MAG: carbohydrate binding family 9 domain-containing protein [Bacteroidetes bacterium]|nr:carbohydrate binding family 9 domain-containing protein [Bacteroidota bacterium]